MTPIIRSALAAITLAASPAAARAPAPERPAAVEDSALAGQDREMLALAQEFARRCAEAMEKWIAAKEVTPERLFGFLYYPLPDTDPPKFTTDYDSLSDRDILGIEEEILARSPVIVFTVMVDRNGYLPTHNQRYAQPLTGNKAADLVGNRTKRIFNDRTGLAAARSTAPYLLQRYQRDTGESMVDLSVPIRIGGRHWGAVRIGYRHVDAR